MLFRSITTNFTEEEFNRTKGLSVFEVSAEKATQLFKRMDKSDEKACIKVCQKIALEFTEIDEFAFGFYINTGDCEPHRCLAFGGSFTTEITEERILALLHTKFYKRVTFKIIDMNANPEISKIFKAKGRIVCRTDLISIKQY